MGIVESSSGASASDLSALKCAVCGCGGGTDHHLFPKSLLKRFPAIGRAMRFRTMHCCRQCHDDLHFYFSRFDLAFKFNSERTLIPELRRRKQMAEVFK